MKKVNVLQVSFQVADALDQPFPDGQFDLVWSMESGEHMPDKKKVDPSDTPFSHSCIQNHITWVLLREMVTALILVSKLREPLWT